MIKELKIIKYKTQTEVNRKVGWAVQKVHTQFLGPISEDGCWAPFTESSFCKSVLNLTRVVTPFSDPGPKGLRLYS